MNLADKDLRIAEAATTREVARRLGLSNQAVSETERRAIRWLWRQRVHSQLCRLSPCPHRKPESRRGDACA